MEDKDYIPKKREWFEARIGKRIYRDHYKCCSHCDDTAKYGLVVNDKQHADYLAMVDNDFGAEGRFLNYRDNQTTNKS